MRAQHESISSNPREKAAVTLAMVVYLYNKKNEVFISTLVEGRNEGRSEEPSMKISDSVRI